MEPDPTSPKNADTNESAQQKTSALLHQLWQKNRPLLAERIALLQRAAQQLTIAPLPEELHSEALSVAHKLAGTLGMFGLPAGTDAARQLELLLASADPDTEKFSQYLSQLIEILATKDSVNVK